MGCALTLPLPLTRTLADLRWTGRFYASSGREKADLRPSPDASPDLPADVSVSTGGTTNTGGVTSTGGTTGTGGAPGTGGSISPSSDAAADVPADVSVSTGGIASSGGAIASGGVPGTGGTVTDASSADGSALESGADACASPAIVSFIAGANAINVGHSTTLTATFNNGSGQRPRHSHPQLRTGRPS